MKERFARAVAALILTASAGGVGYMLGNEAPVEASVPEYVLPAPSANSVRILYSLDKKQNDEELIALINEAEERVYFAVYTFTLDNVADALIAAKKRGVDVRGVMDSSQIRNGTSGAIAKKLIAGGVPVVTEKHTSGSGIMHLKTLVTENAYATGSYNWTKSATESNDELLEIGTDKILRQAYEDILKKLLEAYKGNSAANAADSVSIGAIPYTEAPRHVGEYADVTGTVVRVYTSNTNTTFINFCENYKTCPFSAVVFASDSKKFDNLSSLVGKTVTISGKIVSYEGSAEIILSNPSQLSD